MYSIWCEWEIGQQDRVWTTKESAIKWAKEQFKNWLEAEAEMTYEECKDDGLIGFTKLEVMGE
ncbi:hypothetical protein NoPa_00057 [Pseudomonas phage vB_PpuM-NoPa]|uniref:Uncharacterized protein n=2 Tax=Tartuvirus TaxID=3424912 RepID=A0AAX4MWU5_9CAUD